jgi:ABC-type transport system involved in multi-copper enzyme maturation permease subunit
MRAFWSLARLDLAVWRRSPWAVAAAVIPPLAMLFLVKVLTVSVTVQPVALVVEGTGPYSRVVAHAIEADTGTYEVEVESRARADQLLRDERVTAVIVVPRTFDRDVRAGHAVLPYTLNNVDIDFSDDVRRSIDRTAGEFDSGRHPNPYRIDIAETNLRRTDVPFETYQSLPVLVLLVLSLGVLGGATLGGRDVERGTRGFLRTAPLGPWTIVASRLTGTFIATAVITVPAVVLLALLGTVTPPAGHWPWLFAILAATAVLASALGVLLGTIGGKPTTIALAGVALASYLFFLGGGFTTIAFLPGWLQTLSRAVPTRYAIDGLRQALFYAGTAGLVHNLVVLCAFAAGAVVAGAVALRQSLR